MKVVLRDEASRLYYAASGAWVGEVTQALDFHEIDRAGLRARQCSSLDVSVLLVYDNPACELALNPVYCH